VIAQGQAGKDFGRPGACRRRCPIGPYEVSDTSSLGHLVTGRRTCRARSQAPRSQARGGAWSASARTRCQTPRHWTPRHRARLGAVEGGPGSARGPRAQGAIATSMTRGAGRTVAPASHPGLGHPQCAPSCYCTSSRRTGRPGGRACGFHAIERDSVAGGPHPGRELPGGGSADRRPREMPGTSLGHLVGPPRENTVTSLHWDPVRGPCLSGAPATAQAVREVSGRRGQ
jgi:hypothetical protein